MLDGMRKATQSAVGKLAMTVVMALIIVSFVVWGVGDMLRGFTSDTVAKVGSIKITTQEYEDAKQKALYRLQRQFRQALTPQQARALGLDAQALDTLIDQAALDERARSLGLDMSQGAIADAVRADPSLKGINGEFDRNRFDQLLRDSGMSERGFFADQRNVFLRQQIQYSLVDGLAAPKPLISALQAVKDETREIAYFTLQSGAAGDIPAPTDAALKSFFEERKAAWRAPERRSFDAVAVTPATLAKPDTVSEADARAQYDHDKDGKYTVPEKRKLQQIVYPTEAEAQKAEASIKDGATFDDLAKARNLGAGDLDVGEVTKQGASDPALGEAAFALPEGGVSAPVKGPFGYTLVRVVSITPGSVKPFEEVEPAIKQEIAAGRAVDQVQALHDKIEDAKASGKSVAEAAQSAGLAAQTFEGVDREGNGPSGASANVPDKDEVMPAVFASDVGVDEEALATKDRGYVWFALNKIEPAHDRPFDEVKDKVAAAWRVEEVNKRLADLAAEDVKKLNGGADLAELAKAAGVETKTAKDIKRAGGGDLAANVVAAVFAVGPSQAGSAAAPDGRLVFKVTGDVFPAPVAGDPDAATAESRVKTELSSSLVEQYVDALKRELGVTIDRRAMQSASEGG